MNWLDERVTLPCPVFCLFLLFLMFLDGVHCFTGLGVFAHLDGFVGF